MQRKEKIDQFLINSRGIFRQQVRAEEREIRGIQIVERRQKIAKEWGKKSLLHICWTYPVFFCLLYFLPATHFLNAWENRQHFAMPPTVFCEMTSEKRAQKFLTDDWLCHSWNLLQPIGSTTQIWVVMCHQYGISALISQTSFCMESVGDIAKCCLFSQATCNRVLYIFFLNI